MKTPNLARYSMLAIILWATGGLIIVQMFRVQTSASASALLNQDKHFQGYYETIYPTRGSIYDRWGNPLAVNEQVYAVGVNLEVPYDPPTIASALATALGSNYNDILNLFNQPLTRNSEIPGAG